MHKDQEEKYADQNDDRQEELVEEHTGCTCDRPYPGAFVEFDCDYCKALRARLEKAGLPEDGILNILSKSQGGADSLFAGPELEKRTGPYPTDQWGHTPDTIGETPPAAQEVLDDLEAKRKEKLTVSFPMDAAAEELRSDGWVWDNEKKTWSIDCGGGEIPIYTRPGLPQKAKEMLGLEEPILTKEILDNAQEKIQNMKPGAVRYVLPHEEMLLKGTPEPRTKTQTAILKQCSFIKDILITKNRKYGDSALHPERVFSKASPIEQLNVRIDDKLSRIKAGQSDDNEDTELDLIGYLILRRVYRALEG